MCVCVCVGRVEVLIFVSFFLGTSLRIRYWSHVARRVSAGRHTRASSHFLEPRTTVRQCKSPAPRSPDIHTSFRSSLTVRSFLYSVTLTRVIQSTSRTRSSACRCAHR